MFDIFPIGNTQNRDFKRLQPGLVHKNILPEQKTGS